MAQQGVDNTVNNRTQLESGGPAPNLFNFIRSYWLVAGGFADTTVRTAIRQVDQKSQQERR
jgi:hypothetical protein